MNSDEVGTKSFFRLKAMLVILAIIIVGLISGIVFVAIDHSSNNSGESSGNYELPEGLMRDNLSPEDQVIKDVTIMVQNPDIGMDEIEEYYDDVVQQANKDEDYGFAMKVIVQKVLFLVTTEKDCKKAEDYTNNLDTSMYSRDDLIYLQSNVDSAMWGCGTVEESKNE